MHGENLTTQVVDGSTFEDAYPCARYSNYLYDLLGNLPLLNLWDVSYLYARAIYRDGYVPDCIKDLDQDLLQADLYSLRHIQKWLAEQLAKSIDNKEIGPRILGRFPDGRVDPEQTYIDNKEIDEWLECRSLGASSSSESFYFNFDELRFLGKIHGDICSASQHLRASAYDTKFLMPALDSIDTNNLILENAQLKGQIAYLANRLQSIPQSFYKAPSGHEERHAKNREQILGAALSVIAQWPDQCQNSSGKFEATKIAKLVDEKSLLYWPEKAEPPLSREKMEREISKWINRTGK